MSKKISFSTGDLIIDDKSISFHQYGTGIRNANTINRENIGHVDMQNINILPKASIILWMRVILIGVALIVIGLDFLPLSGQKS
jgi:hypothetical protein